MRLHPSIPATRPRGTIARLARDEGGVAAVEFGMLALPFFLFILGIIGMGLYFFANSSLDYAVETASRKVRTGEVTTGGSTPDTPMTVGQFRDLVCTTGQPMLDCSKLAVMVQHAADWSGITPISCTDDNGNMIKSTGSKDDLVTKYSGDASDVVLITLCYEWDLGSQFRFLKLGSGGDGSGPVILQSASAFKSEPYN